MIYESLVLSVSLYNSETWTLIRNVDIREEVGVDVVKRIQ